ncbi:hypothetical protein [Streptomyces sp. NPDC047928]|uniref:hypothetical protein n=1 Tax=unclassified Streptomyces TaxID=2593676 RepID=UPI003711EBA3
MAVAALLWTATAGTAPAADAPPATATSTHCVPAAAIEGGTDVGLCVTAAGPSMTVTAPAVCHCATSGTWTARQKDRDRTVAAEGELGGRAEYPGPGTYEITATVRVEPGADTPASRTLTGQVRGTFTLTVEKPEPTHRVAVDSGALRPGTTAALTYTVSRVSADGDGSARLGLIGDEGSGIRLVSTDVRCVNPLTGAYPSTARGAHALDCALTDLQPGRPATVTVHVTLPAGACSTIVSKLGYWTPRGQQVSGAMLNGPTVTCAP